MDTMGYNDRKKSGKGVIFGLLIFFALGAGVIYYAVSNEREPIVLGGTRTDGSSNIEIYEQKQEVIEEKLKQIVFRVDTKEVLNKDNQKMKAQMKLPQIFLEEVSVEDINSEIEKRYNETFDNLTKNMNDIKNKYTYNVSYETFDNIIGNKRVLSVVINQKINDDAKKNTTTMNSYKVYNIDLSTGKLVKQDDILFSMLGKDYKLSLKDSVKNYVVNEKKYIKEADYMYTCTGLEEFYIKEGKLHLIFNENDLVKDKYLDILISSVEE